MYDHGFSTEEGEEGRKELAKGENSQRIVLDVVPISWSGARTGGFEPSGRPSVSPQRSLASVSAASPCFPPAIMNLKGSSRKLANATNMVIVKIRKPMAGRPGEGNIMTLRCFHRVAVSAMR